MGKVLRGFLWGFAQWFFENSISLDIKTPVFEDRGFWGRGGQNVSGIE